MVFYDNNFSEEAIGKILDFSKERDEEPFNPMEGADHFTGEDSIFGRLLLVGYGGFERSEPYKSIYLNVSNKAGKILPLAPKLTSDLMKEGFDPKDNLYQTIGDKVEHIRDLSNIPRSKFSDSFDELEEDVIAYNLEHNLEIDKNPSDKVLDYFKTLNQKVGIGSIVSVPLIDKDEFIGVINIESTSKDFLFDSRIKTYVEFIMCNISYVFANHAIIYKRMVERELDLCPPEE
jgi:hypothetical protein